MKDDKFPPATPEVDNSNDHDHEHGSGFSRRDFLKTSSAGIAAGTLAGVGLAGAGLPGEALAHDKRGDPPRYGHGHRVLLKGGIVLSLDPAVGDFEKADVLIEGKKIKEVRPNIHASSAQVVDCRGMIVMPGFVTTHHHQYETLMRSVIPDGLLQGAWPQESYGSVVQNIWTAGRILPDWDLGRPTFDPEDAYLSELVASLTQISQGVTCSTDTSQCSHTPEYTDAMIKGLLDSGARALFDYSGGTNRSAEFPNQPYEHPGLMGDETVGVGRLRKQWFPSEDMLVTLGLNASGALLPGQNYTGWQLARSFGCWINNHSQQSTNQYFPAVDTPAAQLLRQQVLDPNIGPYITLVHCTRFQDAPIRQTGAVGSSPPETYTSKLWQLMADGGVHSSIAVIIEMQMRHGMPPFQFSLNAGILPSLSPDVDTNMTPDPFSLMRGAFCLQRALANDLAHPLHNPDGLLVPQAVTCRQAIEMCTIAGAAGSGLLHKVGTLTPGKEADIVMLQARHLNLVPINNVPGTIVTMMDTSYVRHVMIAGKFKFWNGKLLGWNTEHLIRKLEKAHERVLARINGPAYIGSINSIAKGNNSFQNPYRPNFLDSCCYNGQNTTSPHYVLRP